MTDQELENKIYEAISYESGVRVESLNRDVDIKRDLDEMILVEVMMRFEEEGFVETEFDGEVVDEKVKNHW